MLRAEHLAARLSHHAFLASSVAVDRDPAEVEMHLGQAAQAAVGLDLVVLGPDPGQTGHHALTALVQKKACARVPAQMQHVQPWDLDLRDRQWRKGKHVPKAKGRSSLTADRIRTADRGKIVDHVPIADLGKIVDHVPTVVDRDSMDRDSMDRDLHKDKDGLLKVEHPFRRPNP
jgi:hypothetical protein